MTNQLNCSPRIVCLSHDSIDMLIHLGMAHTVVGRPSGERRTDVRHAVPIGGYGSIRPEKIVSLQPDVVIAYSGFQTGLTGDLIDAGISVLTLSHRSINEIFQSLRLLGRLTDASERAARVIEEMCIHLKFFEERVAPLKKVRVYFEEWDDPMVVAPKWVSEMIHYAGGVDVFSDVSENSQFAKRTIAVADVMAANPEVIVASWCGKPVQIEAIRQRAGFADVPAVVEERVFEVAGALFLQPGPAILKGISDLYNLLHSDASVIRHA
ncbi:MAG: ABC transporter substrate-binding protein [Deltaproteobacteria bacterium]|nr:ABC transporter substrate-binding protein [Deltaproteobacteria bacterium]MBN2674508.1 ABC transporter substrate-binding protein [Deltaproteobacteria bacterium]